MGKKVKRCIRPQCMAIYKENCKYRYCDCGALLQLVEIESGPRKNKKTTSYINEEKCDSKGLKTQEAVLYLLLDNNEEIEYKLGKKTLIGRTSDSVQVDIDLSQYAGKAVSRRHAVISRESNGYYITNLSQTHSVRLVDAKDHERAMEYGQKELLRSEDGILLSRKILLQFIEGE